MSATIVRKELPLHVNNEITDELIARRLKECNSLSVLNDEFIESEKYENILKMGGERFHDFLAEIHQRNLDLINNESQINDCPSFLLQIEEIQYVYRYCDEDSHEMKMKSAICPMTALAEVFGGVTYDGINNFNIERNDRFIFKHYYCEEYVKRIRNFVEEMRQEGKIVTDLFIPFRRLENIQNQ